MRYSAVLEQNIVEVQEKIGYSFKNKSLLLQALTLSCSNKKNNNQRLEFLGDSVLGFIIADYLYKNLPQAHEGILTRIKSYLVSRLVLYRIAVCVGLEKVVKLKSGMNKRKALADTMEAIIGAVYQDSKDIEQVYLVVISLWEKAIEEIAISDLIGPKERLQLYTQSIGWDMPVYNVLDIKGPKHKPVFIVGVYVAGKLVGEGKGSNKKSAEKMAAVSALKSIGVES